MSYRLQVQTLFQLHVDPAFRAAFREDPVAATPGLSEVERHELLKLPVARAKPAHEAGEREASDSQGVTAFMRTGIQARCRIAMPRSYAILRDLAQRSGSSVELDFLRTVEFWRPVPAAYHRDSVEPNPAVHWTETARVLQMANRVFWQFFCYAEAVAQRQPQDVPYLAELARFEFETLARRSVLYKRFVAPGPVPVQPDAAGRLLLSAYAELAGYDYAVADPVPARVPTGVVFLYNGERLRVLQVDGDSRAALSSLDGRVRLGDFEGRTRRVLEGLAGLGVLAAAS